jgi:Zn-dependent peptidase ImmA (M78 family)
VVNRRKSAEHQQYTALHELGHCLLHVNSSPLEDLPISEIEGLADFQADIFAIMWIIRTEDDQKRAEVLNQNPEAAVVTLLAGGMTVSILIFALIAVIIRHFRSRPSASSEEK